jgi:hypothetical protein
MLAQKHKNMLLSQHPEMSRPVKSSKIQIFLERLISVENNVTVFWKL